MSEIEQLNHTGLLIAGNHYLCLYRNGKKITLHDRGGVYYGISWSRTLLFVLWRNHKQGEIILIYDLEFKLIDEIHLGRYLDGHQILYMQDRLFITNTAENSLLEMNLESRALKEIPIPPYGADYNHINGVSYVDARHLYILFANGKIPEKSEIRKYDLARQDFVGSFRVGDQIHNYRNHYITSSYNFEVLHYKNGKVLNSVHLEGWLRGLDLLDNRLLVGSSPLSDRAERLEKRDARIFLLDQNLKFLEQYIIPEIGQINEIRTLSPSSSHNEIIFSAVKNVRF